MRKFIPFIVLAVACIPFRAHGAQPIDVVRTRVDHVMSILQDRRYKDTGTKSLQREKIWDVIVEVFDFTEIAKRSLARNWRRFTPKERREFTDLFSDLLADTYIEKLQSEYEDQKVTYLSQETLSESKAMVKTKITGENVEIPVDYSMRIRDGTWWIYDVRVEGVSLVKNYRSQFREILAKETPAQLIERLRKKVEP